MSDASLKELWQAVTDGNLEACLELVAAGAIPKRSPWKLWGKASLRYLREGTQIDCNPFHLAACLGHLDICKLLLAAGADMNERNDAEGRTALHYAAKYGHANVCHWLLKVGAKVNAKTDTGATPLHFAKNGDVALALLDGGTDPYLTSKYGYKRVNALHIQAFKGRSSVCLVLLEYGVDVRRKTGEGLEAIHLAAEAGHLEICQMLLAAGVPADAMSTSLEMPLHFASRGRSEHSKAVCEMLLAAGAPVNALNASLKTPLHCAIDGYGPHILPICQLLVSQGAHPDYTPANAPKDYLTPFQHAVATKTWGDLLRYFIQECGAQVDQNTLSGRHVLDLPSSEDWKREILRMTGHNA